MEFSEHYPMERRFMNSLQKMTSLKSEKYQDEFFRRIHIINDYVNLDGTFFNDRSVAANVMVTMDQEQVWGEDIVNQ